MAANAHAEGAHGPLHHHFDEMDQQRDSQNLGMWLFLVTELMMFGGLFFTYGLYRTQYSDAFHHGSMHLNGFLGLVNTCVLLVSSFTMAMAVYSSATNRRKAIVGWLVLTWLLGATFLGIKAVEWTADFHEGLIPGINWTYYVEHAGETARLAAEGVAPHQIQLYFTVYFFMTGLHAIHMVVGLALVGVFAFLASRGKFDHGNDQPVEIMGLYWHLIDIIWVFLYPLLYLIAGYHPNGGGGH